MKKKKMARFQIDQTQRKALGICTGAALVVGVLFLRSYLSLILLAAILAFVFNPIYKQRLRKNQKPGRSSFQTTVIAFLMIIIPVALIIYFGGRQIQNLITTTDWNSVSAKINELSVSVTNLLARFGIEVTLDSQSISNSIQEYLVSLGHSILESIPSFISSFARYVTIAIIFIYVFVSLLINQTKIGELLNELNPLGKDIGQLYGKRIHAMSKAMVRGQFIIATICGFLSAFSLVVAGVPELFFFFFLIFTVLSIIPLGSGIVTIPMGVIMILLGNIWEGAFVILWHLLVVTNVDNILRPKLVPKEVKLDPALTILSVFAGIGLFGFTGIVIGPVIMIIIVTTIQIFLDVFRNIHMEEAEAGVANEGIFKKIGNKAKDIMTLPEKAEEKVKEIFEDEKTDKKKK